MNSNNICIKEDFVSYPSIDENEDIYENEDDLLDFTENETDGLYVKEAAKRTFLCKHAGINKPNKTVPLNEQHNRTSCKLIEDMLADIQFWTLEEPTKKDAYNILNSLLEKKANDLKWMKPQQVELYIRYSSVIAHDNTHIGQNIPKNLKSKLHGDYEEFAKKFFQCRNKLSIKNFEHDYIKLIEDYPNIIGYLKQLYESKESWARCYTSSYFTAGMQSINRIESINEVIKKDLDGRYVSLNDLCANIDNEIRIHVTFAITEKIHEQMNLSFLYHAIQIEYNTIDINIKFSYENRCINEIFDLPQGYANAILRDIYDQLVSIWEVRHMKYESSPNYIFLLEN
ncbi:7758_t:CDS:2, partial [Funneliformis geosporum]